MSTSAEQRQREQADEGYETIGEQPARAGERGDDDDGARSASETRPISGW